MCQKCCRAESFSGNYYPELPNPREGGSPAIDAGENIGLPYYGRAPDLGAYERVRPRAPTGLRIISN